MADIKKEEYESLLAKYKSKVEEELGGSVNTPRQIVTKEYQQFRKEFISTHMSIYEQACNLSEQLLKVAPDKKKEADLKEALGTCHLNVTPVGVVSFSLLAPILLILIGSLVSFVAFQEFFFVFFFFIVGVSLIAPLNKLPEFLANSWRLKASNQMVLCIFYVVTYMRHTSNIENAVAFAAEHLSPPLSVDLKKVLWDVETGKYESVKESLEVYLSGWKKWNMEFVESFHLIISSLYEKSEDRRLRSLDRSLDVILNETYEKMLHYAHNLKSPITMLHMLGIILPILGLVILPLVVSFMEGIRWFHIATIYNIALPLTVYVMGKNILSKRPTGYGDTDISEDNPALKKYRNSIFKIGGAEVAVNPLWIAVFIGAVLFLIGFSPIVLNFLEVSDVGIGTEDISSSCGYVFCLLGYETMENGDVRGPFGLGASVLSLAVTLALGLGFGLYFKLKSKNVIKLREKSKKLEDEFASALFQLGNKLGDGFPAEVAVGKVAETMAGTTSGNFFSMVSLNIRRLGMGVEEAIFNPKYGAMLYFPSKIIESSMKVLVESVKKGPEIAAQSLMNVSRYIKEIHKVNERLRDLMADIISSMSSQIKFLTPIIAGIVIGITSMISSIIGKLGKMIASGGGADTGLGALSGISFSIGVPTYFFQIIVGIYVVQIVYILTILSNGIQNGSDKLNERFNLGKNLISSPILFCVVAFLVMVIFNMIAGTILEGVVGI
ncbi:MAG: hypothetical protein QF632_03655 [Candidatus Woesearchaeota archaeon]|jgi:hypothetical protein|nr:hypothetical protein [Candidatus Woesearchaeota archaeon]